MIVKKSNNFVKKIRKASNLAKKSHENTVNAFTHQAKEIENACLENEILRKMLNLKKEFSDIEKEIVKEEVNLAPIEEEKEVKQESKPKSNLLGVKKIQPEIAFSPIIQKQKIDTKGMINTALSQKLKNTKRRRSRSFYFGPSQEEDAEEAESKNEPKKDEFASFDYNMDNISVNTSISRNRNISKLQTMPTPVMKWTMKQYENKEDEKLSSSSSSSDEENNKVIEIKSSQVQARLKQFTMMSKNS